MTHKRLYRFASLPSGVWDEVCGSSGLHAGNVCIEPRSHYHPPAEGIETTFAGWTR